MTSYIFKIKLYAMKNILLTMVLVGAFMINTNAQQQILLDEPVRAGDLTLFKSLSNPSEYYYLPDKPRLAKHSDGKPQFSFVRYVKNEASDGSSDEGIIESEQGGGILHALVELSVSDEQIRRAETSLQRLNGNAKIVGPVAYKSGTIGLVTTVASADGGMTKKVVGLGSAPVLENQRSAVSVQLNKTGAKLLWEMFSQTTTPDFSFSFEMTADGYLSPKNVQIEADFERIYSHKSLDAAAVTPVLAAEIKTAFDELYDEGAIKVTQVGSDEDLNKMRETAYNQLTNVMFDKIAGNGVPQLSELLPKSGKSMLDRATDMLGKAREEVREENRRIEDLELKQQKRLIKARNAAWESANFIRNQNGLDTIDFNNKKEIANSDTDIPKVDLPKKQKLPSLAIGVSYVMKKVKRTGKYKIDLNKYTETTRSFPFDYNPGNVRSICEDCFLEINLDDPLMKQREILVTLGLENSDDFKHVNFVNVVMKKQHQNGETTLGEIRIDRKKFLQTANLSRLIYGWKGDDNRPQWLDYQYKVTWSFSGDHQVATDWITTDVGTISLEPPVVKRRIDIELDRDFIEDENIRGVEIRLHSKLGNSTDIENVSFRPSKNELSKSIEILFPRELYDYEYEVIYSIKGQGTKKSAKMAGEMETIDIENFNEL